MDNLIQKTSVIIPAIDLIDGKVVRLYQGDYNQTTQYQYEPLSQLQAYEQAGTTQLHLVDLTGAKTPMHARLRLLPKLLPISAVRFKWAVGCVRLMRLRRCLRWGQIVW